MKPFTPFSEYSNPQHEIINELIVSQRYGVEYQPMICTKSGEITAYEALARFYTADNQLISPLVVFDFLHHDMAQLRKVESDLKKIQIEYAPNDYELFINVDPHAIGQAVDLENEPLILQLLDHPNLIVELIENSDIHDARAALTLHNILKAKGVQTALDDIGADHALLSLEILSLVNYLKFDLSWLKKIKEHRYEFLFRSMLEFSNQSNKPSILEGIENESMLNTALKYDLSRVQGFHFREL
ncbi:MAG: EAL domain-containing protein, partial [Gammaproteobacteria bacterium]|nr:EAL domain-containing protein [Gammaproteobacteria bacterium]